MASLAAILVAFGGKLLGFLHSYIIIENESQDELVIRYKRQNFSCCGGGGVSLTGSAITLGDHEPDVMEVLLHPRGNGKLPAPRSSKLCELAPSGTAHIELFWPTGNGIYYDPTGHAELVRAWDILTVRSDDSGSCKYDCAVRKGTKSEIRTMKDAASSSRY